MLGMPLWPPLQLLLFSAIMHISVLPGQAMWLVHQCGWLLYIFILAHVHVALWCEATDWYMPANSEFVVEQQECICSQHSFSSAHPLGFRFPLYMLYDPIMHTLSSTHFTITRVAKRMCQYPECTQHPPATPAWTLSNTLAHACPSAPQVHR